MFDNQQYTRRDWRNRNIFYVGEKPKWLSLEVDSKGRYLESIDEMSVVKSDWAMSFINKLDNYYFKNRKTIGFEFVRDTFLQSNNLIKLTEINEYLIGRVLEYLNISLKIERSRLKLGNLGKDEKLIALCKEYGILTYITGSRALSYLDRNKFKEESIVVEIVDYTLMPPISLPVEPSIFHWLITLDADGVKEVCGIN